MSGSDSGEDIDKAENDEMNNMIKANPELAMGTDTAEVTQWFVRDYASIIPNSYKTEYVGRFKSGRKTM